MKDKLKKVIRFITNPRLLLCVAIAWLITNGWSYILFGVGSYFGIHWMTAVAGAYIAFLWLPIPSPSPCSACCSQTTRRHWLF